MQVIRESLPRFTAFCALALVSMATALSRNPYHMATAWMEPSWLSVHIVIGRRSWIKASISSDVLLMVARCFTPWPICCVVSCSCSLMVPLHLIDLFGRHLDGRPLFYPVARLLCRVLLLLPP